MIPAHMLVHTVTVVTPAESANGYGDTVYDYGAAAGRTEVAAWLQQDQRIEQFRDGRDPLDERWLLLTNHAPIGGRDRIEWADHPAGPVTFEIDGPTEPAYAPMSTGTALHHVEAQLRIVSG